MRLARFQTDEAPQVLVGKAFGSRFADGARLRVARADAVQGRALWQSCPRALGRPLKLPSRIIKLRQLSIPGPSLSSRCDDLRESLGRDHHGSSGAAKSWVLHTKVKTWSSWGSSVGCRQSWRLIQEANRLGFCHCQDSCSVRMMAFGCVGIRNSNVMASIRLSGGFVRNLHGPGWAADELPRRQNPCGPCPFRCQSSTACIWDQKITRPVTYKRSRISTFRGGRSTVIWTGRLGRKLCCTGLAPKGSCTTGPDLRRC